MPTTPPGTGLSRPSPTARRELRLAEIIRRREVLTVADPELDSATTNMIVHADALWDPDEGWRGFVAPTEDAAATAAPPQSNGPAANLNGHSVRHQFVRRVRHRSLTSTAPQPDERDRSVRNVEISLDWDVPRPGRRLRRAGRGRSWIVKTAIVVGPLVLVGGLTYSCGVQTGSQRILQPSRLSDQDAARFHLSTYPAAGAAAFGVTYLAMCLTHPTDDVDRGNRLAALAGMTSAGVSPGCGWDGTGPTQQPLSVSWTGTQAPAAGTYLTGVAEQLDFTAAMPDDRVIGVAVPIWAASAVAGPFRIVGDPAFLPATIPTDAPVPAPPGTVDSNLAQSLTPTVLTPFLTAWAASDQVQLGLVLATDATPVASQGLNGQLADPHVDTAQAVVLKGSPIKGYRDGDLISAQVGVTWKTAGIAQQAAYTIALRRTSGRWLVTDITAGPVDAVGGAAPNTSYRTTPSIAPG